MLVASDFFDRWQQALALFLTGPSSALLVELGETRVLKSFDEPTCQRTEGRLLNDRDVLV